MQQLGEAVLLCILGLFGQNPMPNFVTMDNTSATTMLTLLTMQLRDLSLNVKYWLSCVIRDFIELCCDMTSIHCSVVIS